MARPPRPSRAFVARFLLVGAARYGRNCLASLAKLAIGRQAYFSDDDVLFRRYLLQLLGLGRIECITSIAGLGEGAGSHALMAMRAQRFARRFGLTYVHTPLSDIHHADRPARDWDAAWEALFNLGAGEARSGRDPVNYALTLADLHTLFGLDVDPDTGFEETLLRDFRRKYRVGKPPRPVPPPLRVGVHLRQRNAHDFHSDDVADLPRLARTIAEVRTALDRTGRPYRLQVFSQGPPATFDGLGVPRDCLNLDTDAVEAMARLVDSDLLVVSGGTFSHVAGLLCDGIVLADATTQPRALPHWLTYDAAGGIDAEALAGALRSAA